MTKRHSYDDLKLCWQKINNKKSGYYVKIDEVVLS